ncbi:MAG TPA: rhodanese-like domain-containing protein, partial [bacterium]|nr:rhodanese-like domain-containing protein [bacterium]
MSPFSLMGLFAGRPDPASLDPQQVRERLAADPKSQLVDVRSHEERREGYLKGSKPIPLPELSGRLKELDPNRPVLLYCRS